MNLPCQHVQWGSPFSGAPEPPRGEHEPPSPQLHGGASRPLGCSAPRAGPEDGARCLEGDFSPCKCLILPSPEQSAGSAPGKRLCQQHLSAGHWGTAPVCPGRAGPSGALGRAKSPPQREEGTLLVRRRGLEGPHPVAQREGKATSSTPPARGTPPQSCLCAEQLPRCQHQTVGLPRDPRGDPGGTDSPQRPARPPGSPAPRKGADVAAAVLERQECGAAAPLPAESAPPKLSPQTWPPAGTHGCRASRALRCQLGSAGFGSDGCRERVPKLLPKSIRPWRLPAGPFPAVPR